MGYDTTLYIGLPSPIRLPGERTAVQAVATVNLAKAGYRTATGRLLEEGRESFKDTPLEQTYGVYSLPGTEGDVTVDMCYDTPIWPMDRQALIDAMRADQEVNGEYRRFTVAIALLEAFRDDQWADDLLVLAQGH